MRFLLVILSLIFALGACTTKRDDDRSKLLWGHLAGAELPLASDQPMYLINLKAGETYRICLAEYLLGDYPGVGAEIEAAINIWAHYLGRKIAIDITPKPLPRIAADELSPDVGKVYGEICGPGFHVIVGASTLQEPQVGVTWFSYSYLAKEDDSREIVSFQRNLMVQNPKPAVTSGTQGLRFLSLASAYGKDWSAEEILLMLKSRGEHFYSIGGVTLLLPVLIHEFGHVWGMCDQYEGPANCDAKFSSGHLEMGSQMASVGQRQMLYLSDDDILGLRQFLQRDGFAQNWVPHSGLKDKPLTIPAPDLEYAKIHRAQMESQSLLVIHYGLVSHVTAQYNFSLFDQASGSWVDLSQSFESVAKDFRKIGSVLNVTVPNGMNISRVRLKIIIPAASASSLGGASETMIEQELASF